jgi:uracil-DNA glycosylase
MEIKLIDEQYNYKNTTLLEVLPQNEWKDFFKTQKKELKEISDEIEEQNEETIFPLIENVFRIFYEIEPNKISVCILGMSPYETIDKKTKLNNATGIAFSIPKGRVLNPSIRNISNEVKACGYKTANHGNLNNWVKYGVFLLNVSLTVIKDDAKSHIKLYSEFDKNLMEYLSKLNIVWLLWGGDAQKYKEHITSDNIIQCSHPSGLSHTRTSNPFTGSKCFLKVNKLLKKMGKEEIDWSIV